MTTKQILAELVQTGEKISSANQELTMLRTRQTQLKAQMTQARQATLAARAEFKPPPAKKPRKHKASIRPVLENAAAADKAPSPGL